MVQSSCGVTERLGWMLLGDVLDTCELGGSLKIKWGRIFYSLRPKLYINRLEFVLRLFKLLTDPIKAVLELLKHFISSLIVVNYASLVLKVRGMFRRDHTR
jgi:hypothetical protein